MIFTEPLPFAEGVDKLKLKRDLPVELSSLEMQQHTSAEMRDISFFSSRVIDARILQAFRNSAQAILDGKSNIAQQRLALKQLGARLRYRPAEGKEGTLEDLFSNARLDVMLRTNVSLLRNFGQWQQGNRPGELKAFPAMELIRVSPREKKRAWIQRWNYAAEVLGDRTTATLAAGSEADDENGINAFAMKNDSIWVMISRFGLPFAPYDFNSGMGQRAVGYTKAVAVGVMKAEDEPLAPAPRKLTDILRASMDGLDDDLVKALQDDLSDDVEISDGILRFKNERDAAALRERGRMVWALSNAGFNYDEARSHGRWTRNGWTTPAKMADAFARFKTGGHPKPGPALNYRVVTASEARQIKQATGIDVTGYAHATDEGILRHIAREHGNPVTEARRGLIAVTTEDFHALPRMFSRARLIARVADPKSKNHRIIFEHTVDKIWTVIEEVRPNTGQLALVSFYKRKLGSKPLQHLAALQAPKLANELPVNRARSGGQTSETCRKVTKLTTLRYRGQAVLRHLQEAACS